MTNLVVFLPFIVDLFNFLELISDLNRAFAIVIAWHQYELILVLSFLELN